MSKDDDQDIWITKYNSKDVELPCQKNFLEGTHPEMLRVTFESGDIADIVTMRCNAHLHCNCGLDTILKLHKHSRSDYAKMIRSYGNPVSFIRYVTRINKAIANFNNISNYKIYGPVDTEIESQIQDKLLFVESVKQKEFDYPSRKLGILRKEAEEFIIANKAYINIFPRRPFCKYEWNTK